MRFWEGMDIQKMAKKMGIKRREAEELLDGALSILRRRIIGDLEDIESKKVNQRKAPR